VREAAAEALSNLACRPDSSAAQVSETAKELVPAICERLAHRNADVRQCARAALQQLGRRVGEVFRHQAVSGSSSDGDSGAVFASAKLHLRAVLCGVGQAAPGRRARVAAVEVLGDALVLLAGTCALDGASGGEADVTQASAREWQAPVAPVAAAVEEGKEPPDAALEEALALVGRALSDRSPLVRVAASRALGGGPGGAGAGIGAGVGAFREVEPGTLRGADGPPFRARIAELCLRIVDGAVLQGSESPLSTSSGPPSPGACPSPSVLRRRMAGGMDSPARQDPEQALQLLRVTAEPGDKRAVLAAVGVLRRGLESSSGCPSVPPLPDGARSAAADALGGLASPTNPEALAALLAGLRDPDSQVQDACFRALDDLGLGGAPRGGHGNGASEGAETDQLDQLETEAETVSRLCDLARDEAAEPRIRRRALQSLSRLAPKGDEQAMAAAILAL
ncbi:unnamed protein product, partial [Polarella glacialis]